VSAPETQRDHADASERRSWIPHRYRPASERPRISPGRVILLSLTGLCIYLLLPKVTEVFEAWDRLGKVDPRWIPVIVGAEVASFATIWMMQKLALPDGSWFAVITTHLAGNAFNKITPLGGATGAALQARMLTDSGVPAATASSAMAAQSILGSVALGALPLVTLPLLALTGTKAPGELMSATLISGAVFVMLGAVFVVFLFANRPLEIIGRGIDAVTSRARHRPQTGLGDRLVRERDGIRSILGSRWPEAVATSVGRWVFEYVALLATLIAIGASPDPVLTLFAITIASLLTLVPLTPGGIGFVEVGLTGTLVAIGIGTKAALLATLVFRLVSFWIPLPIGLGAAYVFRRRYPRRHENHAAVPAPSTPS
jgi:uncharacterized protein (TIRG00374 family)